jgi:hypothetical protein
MTGTVRVGKKRLIAGLTLALGAVVIAGPSSSQGAPTLWNPGDIIVADSLDKQIEAVNPETGARVPVSTGGNFDLPTGVAFDGDGNILVVDRDAFGDRGGVIRVDKVTGAQTVVSNNAISDAAGGEQRFSDPISIDRKGDFAYVTDFGGKPSRLVKVSLTTGKQTMVSGGKNIGDPLGVDTSLKEALIADAGSSKSNLRLSGGVISVNLQTGKQTVVATKPEFDDAGDIAVESKDSALVVENGLVRLNLDTGKTKTIFKGRDSIFPAGVAAFNKNTAFIAQAGFNSGAIYSVNLKNGDLSLITASGLNNPLGLEVAR